MLRILKLSLIVGCLSVALSATDIYFSPTSAGSNNGTSCSNAYAYNDGTHGWSLSAQQSAGNNLHICSGTYTAAANGTLMTFVNSGSSGNPITLIADQGPVTFQATYFNSSKGAITNTGVPKYLVVNGDDNLTIENTANGTQLANQQTSYGIELNNCTYCTVENATVKNIYVNNGSSPGATDTGGVGTVCIFLVGTSTGAVITGNTVSQCKTGIGVSPDGGSPADASNITISNNTVSDMDWGVFAGGGDSSDTLTGVAIHDNSITNWTNWWYPASAFHQDGIMLYNVGNPSAGLTASLYNNNIYGDFGDGGSPTGEIYCADFTTCTIYNNLLVNTGTVSPFQAALMWLGQSSNFGKSMYVYNNTMVGTANGVCITLNISGTGTIENNICSGPNTIISSYITTQLALTSAIATSNYNVWSCAACSHTVSYNEGGSGKFVNYSSWQQLGYDANSSTSTPNLNGSYIPQSPSSAIGLGANLTGLMITTLGTSAPQSFGTSGSCGTGCDVRPSTSAWYAGAYQAAVSPASNLNASAQ